MVCSLAAIVSSLLRIGFLGAPQVEYRSLLRLGVPAARLFQSQCSSPPKENLRRQLSTSTVVDRIQFRERFEPSWRCRPNDLRGPIWPMAAIYRRPLTWANPAEVLLRMNEGPVPRC
ncbi:hypothetical protein CONLIGDRAFT_150215 [Coniochaeta ligniaria NRRL 30616]|uniref:Secreted protein n=1 Tax=Coniochaeta ligniaria NRRL 30616 TaxID=1408157 RepID=A0A1J7I604_9PEZI|nr:hypothetical protein CONLIGDRAFT_150215 [Coniochaeta ligniaria NRRL 30616]